MDVEACVAHYLLSALQEEIIYNILLGCRGGHGENWFITGNVLSESSVDSGWECMGVLADVPSFSPSKSDVYHLTL